MGAKLSDDKLSSLHLELDVLEHQYFPGIPGEKSKVARSDYLDALKILSEGTLADEETQDYIETSKSQLWNDSKRSRNAAVILSYIAGCLLGIALMGEISPFSWLLLQFLAIAVGGVVIGGIIFVIVTTGCYAPGTDSKISLVKKILIFLLIPIALMVFFYFRK